MRQSALFIVSFSLCLSVSHPSCSFSLLLFMPVSTLDRCALVPTCVGRWNIKHVISLGSNKMGCQFSPGTRMKKKFLQVIAEREIEVFLTFHSVPHSFCRTFWKTAFSSLWLVKMCKTFRCKRMIGKRKDTASLKQRRLSAYKFWRSTTALCLRKVECIF